MSESGEEKGEEQFDDLRLENEIKKIKLALEHGGHFISPIDEDLPPELEREWLDYVQQFEEELAKRKKILVFNLIGRPTYRLVNNIPDAEITEELNKIRDILHHNAITVDTICKVDDRELYRFITDELFREETNDLHIEGMTTCFIYEEYHPNHDYDIRSRCNEFVNHILDKKKEWAPDYLGLAKVVKTSKGMLTNNEVVEKIIHFRDAFSRLIILDFKITSVVINENTAEAECEIRYTATMEDADEEMTFSGDTQFGLTYTSKLWVISRLSLPGLPL